MKLTAQDYVTLERSWISRVIANAAGLYRLPSLEARDLVGRKGGGNYAGIVFPYRWPGTKDSVLYRLRLDHPPVDATTGKVEYKYLSAKGERNRLYFPPCEVALVGDISMPVVITEGEKKALALWRMALESNGTGKPAFLPIALAGVWSFRGTTGIRTDAKGERGPEKGIIPDFDRIAWTGRRVTILFDANAATNEMVRAARRELARNLTHRGAEVWIADLPAVAGVNGIDDYLGSLGLSSGLEILKQAVRYEWRKELIRGDNDKILPILANAITALRSAPEWCGVLGFNEHALSVATIRDAPFGRVDTWTDYHTYLLVDWFQHHGLRVAKADADAAVETVGRDRGYHPVRDYLDSLKWDKTPRIDDWLTLYLGVDSSDYSRAVGARWLISAVARIYEPGCQADHVLILEGPQGQGKSTALRTVGAPFYSDDIAELGTKDASLGAAGVWIVELPELDAVERGDDSPNAKDNFEFERRVAFRRKSGTC